MSSRDRSTRVALRGGLIGLVAGALATVVYLGGAPSEAAGARSGQVTGAVLTALPVGLGSGVLLAWMLHLRRPWAVGVAGMILSVAGAIAAFVVLYRMLDMSGPMQAHPAWPVGVLLIVIAAAYAWAAVLADD